MEEERLITRLEIVGTVVISIATLAIAWCSYQGALWGGIQTIALIESSADDRRALEKTALGKHQQEIDALVMINFVNAVVDQRKERVNFYLTHGRPEIVTIYKGWLKSDPLHNPNAPPHPMAMKEYQEMMAKLVNEEKKFRESADRLKDQGLKANFYSDNYVLFTVVFGIVLFLNGISAKVKNIKIMNLFSMASVVICIIGLILVFTRLPITTPD